MKSRLHQHTSNLLSVLHVATAASSIECVCLFKVSDLTISPALADIPYAGKSRYPALDWLPRKAPTCESCTRHHPLELLWHEYCRQSAAPNAQARMQTWISRQPNAWYRGTSQVCMRMVSFRCRVEGRRRFVSDIGHLYPFELLAAASKTPSARTKTAGPRIMRDARPAKPTPSPLEKHLFYHHICSIRYM